MNRKFDTVSTTTTILYYIEHITSNINFYEYNQKCINPKLNLKFDKLDKTATNIVIIAWIIM